MKRKSLYTLFIIATAALLSGCAARRQALRQGIGVSPAPAVVTTDSAGHARVRLMFRIPARYLARRSRLIILPRLVVAGDTLPYDYAPVVVDAPIYGKKNHRRQVLEGYADPYAGRNIAVKSTARALEIPYDDVLPMPAGVDSARLVGLVTTDGCGECSTMDTLQLATIGRPAAPPEPELGLEWIEPVFRIRPKVVQGRGVARLQFVINRHDINLAMGNNRAELADMVARLAPVLADTLATLTSLDIYGMASADGSLAFNTTLARNRAEAAKRWLTDTLAISPDVQRIITVGSRPEGWQPVLSAMTADGCADSAAVKAILEKYADRDDDVQERYIRRLPAWKTIRERYLQKDRKVEYEYSYTIRSFTTDAELLDMYGKRPDAFNEDELLRVAALVPEARKEGVYRTLLARFPDSRIGRNNLAVLLWRQGRKAEARRLAEQLTEGDER